jgi:2,4-dienoyl-CoA reductase-like NADH-dependent reductase (Old Yellow Enzyme family)
MTSALFTPLRVRDTEFRNRVWVAPMCQYSAEGHDGLPTDWHMVHLGSLARGGAGLVIVEATAVLPEGRITAWDLGLWNDAQRDVFASIVAFMHSQGARAGIQLAHAGRKASTYRDWSGRGTQPIADGGWQTLAPSAVAFEGYDAPRAMTAQDIDAVVAAFGLAARRAVEAGFDVIDIHGAHGYLIHQFLSPLSNLRDDEYGGALENRARLLLRVVGEVRAAVGPSFPVFLRLSATDWVEPNGWTLEQTITVAHWARDAGVDLFDVSSGGLIPGARVPLGPGYQVHFAAAVREATGTPVGAAGLVTDPVQAEEIVASGSADAVLIGREFLRDPNFALRAAHELGVDVDYWPHPLVRGAWPS